MARIRTLKPEFWPDEKLAPLDPLTRLVFLGLISMADDMGRLVDNVKLLDGLLFPETDDSCRDALDTLARLSRIGRYTSASGQRLIQVVNWAEHQKVDRPSKYSLPAPTPEDVATWEVAGHSRHTREDVASASRESRAPTYDHLPSTNDHNNGADAPASSDNGVPQPTPSDRDLATVRAVLEHYQTRHPKSRPFTEAARKLVRGRLKDGYSPEDLCTAIDGNADDDWHQKTGRHAIRIVFKDSDSVSQYLKLHERQNVPMVDENGELTEAGRRAAAGEW